MSRRAQWVVVAGVVLASALGLTLATRALSDDLRIVAVGSRAPAFSASTLDSVPRTRTMADYRGQVVLLNIWATWCPPCRVEMPAIEALHRDYAPRGLKVVAVSVDDAASVDAMRDFVREYGLTFEVLHDPSRGIQRAWQTTGVPETFVIARDGTIRRKVAGMSDWNSASSRAVIEQLLAEPAPAGEGRS